MVAGRYIMLAKKSCEQSCIDHVFSFKSLFGVNSKYDVYLQFCPKSHRDPLLAQSTHPQFNFDKLFYTRGFVLGVDYRATQNNSYQDLIDHTLRIRQSMEKNCQIEYASPKESCDKCHVCGTRFRDYYTHIMSKSHKQNLIGCDYQPDIRRFIGLFQSNTPVLKKRRKRRTKDEMAMSGMVKEDTGQQESPLQVIKISETPVVTKEEKIKRKRVYKKKVLKESQKAEYQIVGPVDDAPQKEVPLSRVSEQSPSQLSKSSYSSSSSSCSSQRKKHQEQSRSSSSNLLSSDTSKVTIPQELPSQEHSKKSDLIRKINRKIGNVDLPQTYQDKTAPSLPPKKKGKTKQIQTVIKQMVRTHYLYIGEKQPTLLSKILLLQKKDAETVSSE